MRIEILTIFPNMFSGFLGESIIARAIDKNLVSINIHNLRDWTTDSRKTVDDRPFGGGPGMVMMIEPIYKALTDINKGFMKEDNIRTILTSAKGEPYTQQRVEEFAKVDGIIIICGHYEGVDERVGKYLVDHEISIGPYVLTGGELPAMIIADSITRKHEGVLGNSESLLEESHSNDYVEEYPQFTRPSDFQTNEGNILSVPKILLSGNHKEIENWREENSKKQ